MDSLYLLQKFWNRYFEIWEHTNLQITSVIKKDNWLSILQVITSLCCIQAGVHLLYTDNELQSSFEILTNN